MSLDIGADDDLDLLFDDQGHTVTWSAGGAHSVAPATLTETPAFTDTSLTAVKMPLTRREVMAAPGYVEGDVRWLIRVADLVAAPTSDCKLLDGATTWYLRSWTLDDQGLAYECMMYRN